jgi:hypothetical protein
MKIKVTLKNKEVPAKTPKFPCVKIWTADVKQNKTPLIVLFNGPKTGMVISSNDQRVGNYQDYWVDPDSHEWMDFEGSIEFSK